MNNEENDRMGDSGSKRCVKKSSARGEKSSGRGKKTDSKRQMKSLRVAASQIADMLCEFSSDRELFVSDGASERRLDTKTLKEFSAVLKEISAVISELDGEKTYERSGVRIEFSGEALDMGI